VFVIRHGHPIRCWSTPGKWGTERYVGKSRMQQGRLALMLEIKSAPVLDRFPSTNNIPSFHLFLLTWMGITCPLLLIQKVLTRHTSGIFLSGKFHLQPKCSPVSLLRASESALPVIFVLILPLHARILSILLKSMTELLMLTINP
jgi:hypothetical protein